MVEGIVTGPRNALDGATVPPLPSPFWIRWLLVASALVVGFGLTLVLAPTWTRQAFSLMLYASASQTEAFGPEAMRYLELVHAVLGAVLAGWGVALWYASKTLVAAGSRVGWNLVTWPLVVWFVPDTTYSLWSGFWPNAVLNTAFVLMFAPPLIALRRACWRPSLVGAG
jgi:hypothetical protein